MTLADTVIRVECDARKLGAALAVYHRAGLPDSKLQHLATALANFSAAIRHTTAALSAASIAVLKSRAES